MARWMSEKLDGIRAYWDGNKLWTRKGREISLPQEFFENFPKIPLDGELFMGRNTYEQLMSIINTNFHEGIPISSN